MTLDVAEFIRRFLIHVMPGGFHRIRHYGLFANAARSANLAKVRALLQPHPQPPPAAQDDAAPAIREPPRACPCCGGRMLRIETFDRGVAPRTAPVRPVFRIDTS